MRKVNLSVTPYTESDQDLYSVSGKRASEADMVGSKVAQIPACLGSSSVPLEHAAADRLIGT